MNDHETLCERSKSACERSKSAPIAREDLSSITGLLDAWRRGQPEAAQNLMSRIYPQLRAMATVRLPRDGRPWTLEATEIVHEAYLRLLQQSENRWRNQAQFFKIAARIMRRVIADHARRRRRQKRGEGRAELSLSQISEPAGALEPQRLEELLEELAKIDARAARVTELRVCRGMKVEEVAAAMDVSLRTVARDWRFARAWLRHQLSSSSERREKSATRRH